LQLLRNSTALIAVCVNGTIKNATVKAITYQNIDEMKQDLNKFLIFYNFNRGHGGLRKETLLIQLKTSSMYINLVSRIH
jgi:hypothetical protein